MLRSVGRHQQGLGPVHEIDGAGVEQDGPQAGADLGAARLPGGHRVQILGQAPGLGRLAAALAALEGHEAAPRRIALARAHEPDRREGWLPATAAFER